MITTIQSYQASDGTHEWIFQLKISQESLQKQKRDTICNYFIWFHYIANMLQKANKMFLLNISSFVISTFDNIS